MEHKAGEPSTSSVASVHPLGQGPTPYYDTSQFRNWRYSSLQLRELRQLLNKKAQEILAKNQELEKQAQISLGHNFTDPPPPTTYLSVDEELLLVRFYCDQASKIVRDGFQLPDAVETTAVTYLKRFYLKNSVMEWHPKIVMPTCVYLAAKTTNYPIPMSHFRARFAKLNPQDILDNEFLVAQSLAFEFWVRGPDKALRGWALDLQSQPGADFKRIQDCIPKSFEFLATSRLTDLEFIYSPSQISLACLHLSNPTMVDSFLEWQYENASPGEEPFGKPREWVNDIIEKIETVIKSAGDGPDLSKVKGIDKRLKSCTNPEKVPGTALYIKRKQEQEAIAAAIRAEKTLKLKKDMSDEMVFGDIIQTIPKKERKPMSPRVSLGADRSIDLDRSKGSDLLHEINLESESSSPQNRGEPTGMGVKDEAMGLLTGGSGLKEVGLLTEES